MNYINFNDIDLTKAFVYECPTCRGRVQALSCPKCQRILDPQISVPQLKAALSTYLDGLPEGRLKVNENAILDEMYPADLARFIALSAAALLVESVSKAILPQLIAQTRTLAQTHPGLKAQVDELREVFESEYKWFKDRQSPMIANPILNIFKEYAKNRTVTLANQAETYMKALYSQNFGDILARFCDQADSSRSLFVSPLEVRKKHEYQAIQAVIVQFQLLFSGGRVTAPQFAPLEVIG